MAGPRPSVRRVVRATVSAAVVAGVVAVVRDQLIRRNYERYGPEPLQRP